MRFAPFFQETAVGLSRRAVSWGKNETPEKIQQFCVDRSESRSRKRPGTLANPSLPHFALLLFYPFLPVCKCYYLSTYLFMCILWLKVTNRPTCISLTYNIDLYTSISTLILSSNFFNHVCLVILSIYLCTYFFPS